MATEIELKYLISNDSSVNKKDANSNVISKVTQLLEQKKHTFTTDENLLNNYYFDTSTFQFRQNDFGLRVRSKNGQNEQTIKTAGQAIGGLHKRPEYNIDIEKSFPDLRLFPDEIWPKNINVDAWQSNLMVLFSTDFVRYTWLVTYNKSTIEVAFDSGTVSSSGRETELCELELELVSGDEHDIFLLAAELSSVLLMRPGIKTKAARGYQLFHNKPVENTPTFYPLISLNEHSSSPLSTFVEGSSFCLTHLHNIIEAYFSNPSLLLVEQLSHTLLLLRHGCWLFEESLNVNTAKSSTDEEKKIHLALNLKVVHIRQELSHFLTLFAWVNNAKNLHEIIDNSSRYRKKIEYNQQLIQQLKLEERRFPKTTQVFELLQSKRFNCLQLSILELIVESDTANFSDEQFSLQNFASNALENSLEQLAFDISSEQCVASEQYLSYKRILHRSLLTGSWFGLLFDNEERSDYRAPWLDLIQGITELETLSMLREQLILISEQENSTDKLLNWLDRKIENLLTALDGSRNSALQVPPYWRY